MTSANDEILPKNSEQEAGPIRESILIAAASVLLVLPCFWHEFLVCVDLGSHTYAAWIATLISRGDAPGLYIATQKSNVLFDWILSASCTYFGYGPGEKIAAAIAVLIFFWGAFAFFTVLATKRRWDLALPLAMFSYGWTFQTGLFNYYLSVGLALAALAALWTRETRGRIVCLALLPLVMLAHPLGFVVFVAFAVFEEIAHRFAWRGVLIAFIASVISMVVTRSYLASHYLVSYSGRPLWTTTGADQLVLYGPLYVGLAFASLFLFVTVAIKVIDPRWSRPEEQRTKQILVGTLYILVLLAIVILPDEVVWNVTTSKASLLVNRATLVAAILLFALTAVSPSSRWRTASWGVISVVFFISLYISMGTLSKLQRSAYDTVRGLPPGVRLSASGNWQPLLGVNNPHLAERACVERCFIVSNYELVSNQFRVRVKFQNPLVSKDLRAIDSMQEGLYVVKPEDLPLFAIHPCEQRGKVCVGQLKAGDRNGNPSIELGTAVAPSNP